MKRKDGSFEAFVKIVVGVIGSVVVLGGVVFFLVHLFAPVDDTDKDRWNRSGMTLTIDHRTGCHYLSRLYSEMTPRLDREGNHICE